MNPALLLVACMVGHGADTPPGSPRVEVGGVQVQELPPPPPAAPGALLEGCVERVEDLPPASAYYKMDDPRLRDPVLIVVLKERRRLMRFENGVLRTGDNPDGSPDCWPVALGVLNDRTHPVGPKRQRGDRKTPEGWYRTSDKPSSQFYHALWISYPNQEDGALGLGGKRITQAQYDAIAAATRAGRLPPQDTPLGGDLLIHGGGASMDWTWGCVGMENSDIDVLRSTLPKGMKATLLILP